MSGINVYNPTSLKFELLQLSDSTPLPLAEKLLLNILIELQVHTEYLSAMNPITPSEEPSDMRGNIVSQSFVPNLGT